MPIMCSPTIPSQMKAIRYNKPGQFELVNMPVPEPRDHEVLVKGKCVQLHQRLFGGSS